jgi:hypothetical protein
LEVRDVGAPVSVLIGSVVVTVCAGASGAGVDAVSGAGLHPPNTARIVTPATRRRFSCMERSFMRETSPFYPDHINAHQKHFLF